MGRTLVELKKGYIVHGLKDVRLVQYRDELTILPRPIWITVILFYIMVI
jgi:hypothetical protein